MTIITSTGKEIKLTASDFPVKINNIPTEKGYKDYQIDKYKSGICMSGKK